MTYTNDTYKLIIEELLEVIKQPIEYKLDPQDRYYQIKEILKSWSFDVDVQN